MASETKSSAIQWEQTADGMRGKSRAGVYRVGQSGSMWSAAVGLGAGIAELLGTRPTRAAIMAVCEQHADRVTATNRARSAA